MTSTTISLYTTEELLRWYEEWASYYRLVSLGGAIARHALMPTCPFSQQAIANELKHREQLQKEN